MSLLPMKKDFKRTRNDNDVKKEIQTNMRITWNIAKTVTGSVDDIRAPNIRHSIKGSLYMRYVIPPRYLKQ